MSRPEAAFRSIELFTGAGGLAIALSDVGFDHLLAVEWDRRACATLRMNAAADHPSDQAGWPLIEGDISTVDFTPWQGSVEVVAAGVPCQPWSLGGAHKGYEDVRNLWPQLFRTVRETRPLAVVAENVRGIMRPAFTPYRDYILREMEAPFEQRVEGEDWTDHNMRLIKALRVDPDDATERYHVYCVPVNAADYGVPQLRRRVFVVAFRSDLDLGSWSFPRRTHSKIALRSAQTTGSYWDRHGLRRPDVVESVADDGLTPWLTLRDAIADLPEPGPDKSETPGWHHHVRWPGARRYPGHTPNRLDQPAKTVKAGVHGVPGGESVLLQDDGSLRYLTVREVARIMTFPDHWKFAGPRGEQMRQLGNAVPVRLGAVVARSVASTLRGALHP